MSERNPLQQSRRLQHCNDDFLADMRENDEDRWIMQRAVAVEEKKRNVKIAKPQQPKKFLRR